MHWKDVTRNLLEQHISDQQVRISKIISLTMMGGVTIFALIVLTIYLRKSGNADLNPMREDSFHLTLTVVLYIFFAGSQILSRVVLRNLWQESALNTEFNALSAKEPTEKQVVEFLSNKLRTSHIISMAVLEGVALMGLIFIFIPITENGAIPLWSWLDLIPVVYFYLAGASILPNKEKMVNQLEWRLRQMRRNQ